MLSIYEKMFSALEQVQCKFAVCKGIDHLEEDLKGERGDIDLYVESSDRVKFQEAAHKSGFFLAKNLYMPGDYYFGRDPVTSRVVMLDVEFKLRLGAKPIKPYFLDCGWKDLDISKKHGLPIFSEGLRKRIEEINSMLVGGTLAESTELHSHIRGQKFSSTVRFFFKRMAYFAGRITGGAQCRVRSKGMIIAFVGVDGSGKSTIVDSILKDSYYQKTGVKRIYFGGREYWIPGAEKAAELTKGIPLVRDIFRFVLGLDRQMRLLKAFYYRSKGFLVVGDRYFYDDEIYTKRMSNNLKGGAAKLSQIVKSVFRPRLIFRPDAAIFLDVSSKVALSRKEEYPLEVMEKVNSEYKAYMSTRREVLTVDADQSLEKVRSLVFELLRTMDSDR